MGENQNENPETEIPEEEKAVIDMPDDDASEQKRTSQSLKRRLSEISRPAVPCSICSPQRSGAALGQLLPPKYDINYNIRPFTSAESCHLPR